MSSRVPSLLVCLFTVLLSGLVPVSSARAQAQVEVECEAPVTLQSGQLRGVKDKKTATCSYKGIPYAAPPVGDLRWKPPQPPLPWEGVRDGSRFGPRCMQEGVMELINHDPAHKMSEDCLTVNVWRPRRAGVYPVMVWFHGGAYYGGTANTPAYHGDHLAERGVIVVGVNYRLNVFGFLATEALAAEDPHHSAGNYGLLDHVQALQWVRDNIVSLGGDPDNVTIFGESAGGWTICNLLANPLAKGLFHRAIMESGGCQAAISMERGYSIGKRVEKDVGCAPGDLACMRALPAKKLTHKAGKWVIKGFDWQGHIDGYVLKDHPIDVLQSGEFNRVPFIAGANRNEADVLTYVMPRLHHGRKSRYEARIGKLYGAPAAPELSQLYSLQTLKRPRVGYQKMFTDAALFCPTLNGLTAASKWVPETWFYRFDYDHFRFGHWAGAPHGTEIPFVYGSHRRQPFAPLYSMRLVERAKPLSEAMAGYWVNFALNGDPNGEGLPEWPALGKERRFQKLNLKVESDQIDAEVAARCDYWRAHAGVNPWLTETLGLVSPQKRGFTPQGVYSSEQKEKGTEPSAEKKGE